MTEETIMLYIYILVTILIVQQLLDVFTTVTALKTGKAVEANKILKKAMDKIGVTPALVAFKIPFVTLILLFPEPTVVWYVALLTAVLGYTWVLYNNFTVLRRIGAL